MCHEYPKMPEGIHTCSEENRAQDNTVVKIPHIEITQMNPRDFADVLEIESVSFMDPWSERIFLQTLESPLSRCFVARLREEGSIKKIVAYLVCWIVAGEVHIHRIAVDDNFRRNGIATALVMEMIRGSLQEGATKCVLEVASANLSARKLYEKIGFRTEGLRKKYYDETGDDALVMTADLTKWEAVFHRENNGCESNCK